MRAQQAAYEAALAEERRIRQENEQKQAPRWPRCTTTFKVFLSKWVIPSQPFNSLWLFLLLLLR